MVFDSYDHYKYYHKKIDDMIYNRDRSFHRKGAKAYNKKWGDFFKRNPDASQDQIKAFAESIKY